MKTYKSGFRRYCLALLSLSSLLILSCNPKNENTAADQLGRFITKFTSESGNQGAVTNDMSASYYAEQLKDTKAQLNQLREIDPDELKGDDLIDWKFAQSILVGRELEQEKMMPWKKNPRLYMAFTRISNVIERPGTLKDKIEEIEERLKFVPSQLNNAMNQIEIFVPRFQELSVFMAENGKVLFDNELPEFIKTAGDQAEHLTELTVNAKNSLTEFISFLKNDLPQKQKGQFAIGSNTYNEMLKGQFLMDYDADSLWNFGWSQFNATVEELTALAKRIDPSKTWQELAIEVKNEYPEPDNMIAAHQEWVDKAGLHIKENDLIPIPWPERVNVVPRAEYLRKTSYYGNFSRARSKDEEGIFTSEWMINPFEHQWDAKTKQEYLVEHDWGVIIVTAPHETYGGHHVQGLYQMHNPRPLRKNNGISIFSEGWGLYNEQLMQETGFFPNERIHLRQLQLRLWRNARVIYDTGMHTGKLTYEDAISLMTDQVGFLRWAAQLEIDSSSARPGYFIGYFMGMTEILAMREAYMKKMGDSFTLKDFHEKLLKIGNMPPSLMKKALMD